MKKAISVLLCLCLALSVFTVVPFAASAAEVTEGFVGATSGTTGSCRWSLDDDGNLTISGNGAMGDYSSKYSGGTYITTAPWGTNIKTVIIEDGVTSIGKYAFCRCTGLTSVTIPDSVTSIGDDAFYNCTGLTSVTIPDSVTSIGDYVFAYCTGLTSVTIPDSVTSIGSSAFYNTAWYNNQPDGLIYAGKVAYKYKGTMPDNTSITLQEGTKGIAGSAFNGCKNLTSVTIPDSVTNIGRYAFNGCKNLTSVTIPDSVTSIGERAFYITSWYNNKPDGLVYAGKVAYKFKGTMSDNTSIDIQDGTKGIAGGAFDGCANLTSITIPDSVTSIGNLAFDGCTRLTSVTIPDSVTSIGNYAFSDCTGLTSVTIPDSVTSIGYEAFCDCTGLTSVTIPDSVTSIGDRALGYYYNYDYKKVAGFTIYGIQGSKAEQYAKDNGFEFIAAEKICPHCHSLLFSEQMITFAATCTEDGERYWQCDHCGELGEDVLPALGHDYIASVTPPTCTNGGYTTYTCSRCKDVYVSDEVAAQGHDYQAVVTAPTCTEGGFTTYTCSRCKDAYVTDEVAALGHDYHRADVVPPNCTEQGYTTYTCSRCKDAYVSDEVAARGHDYQRVDVVSPSCTEQGYTTYTCSRCSEIKKDDFVDALGHNCTITVKRQPTETQQGLMTSECQRCGLKKNVLLPVLSDQDYSLTNTATCTEAGVMTYTLKDKTYGVYSIEEQVPAKGHTVVIDSAVEANCYHDGLTEGSHCSTCGMVFVAQQKIYPSGTTGDCTWEKKGDVLIISGNGKMGDYTYNSAAPWRNSNITKVIIEDGVTNIGDYAFFECGKLVDVYIPQTVKTIGKEAFVDSGVNNLYIPSSVVSIDNQGVGYRRIHYSFGDIFDKVSGFTISGIPNSEAQRYANEYGFTFVAQYQPPEVPIVDITVGDVNGDGRITISDVTAIQRHMAEYDKLTGTALLAADTDGDGKVTIDDATHLQRYLAEFDVVLGKQITA